MSDLRYQCYNEEWVKWSTVSIISIFIYPIGIPLLFFVILYRNKHKLWTNFKKKVDNNGRTISNIKNRFGFLYGRYKKDKYYFEVIEFNRKLILVGAIMFLMPGSIMQISIAFIISTIFFILHIKLQPYNDNMDEHLQTITLLASMITLFSAIMLKAVQNSINETGYGKELFEFLMPCSNILVFILLFYVIATELWKNIETVYNYLYQTFIKKKQ